MKQVKFLLLIYFSSIFAFHSLGQEKTPAKTLTRLGNIFLIYSNGSQKQLTYNNTDTESFILPNSKDVIFIRQISKWTGNNEYQIHKIMKVDYSTLVEQVITERKPFLDGNDNTSEILNVVSPSLSPDNQFIYFITEKYVTGGILVKVNLSTGKWTEFFSAESYTLVESGQFKGCFFVGVSEVGPKGRDVYFKLAVQNGKILKEFESYEAMISFRNEILG